MFRGLYLGNMKKRIVTAIACNAGIMSGLNSTNPIGEEDSSFFASSRNTKKYG
jgi:hypothetical protein